MKLGIVGYSLSGRSTVFEALTGARGEDSSKNPARQDQRIGTVVVADKRVDFLSEMYAPKKTTYAKVEYLLPSDFVVTFRGGFRNRGYVADRAARLGFGQGHGALPFS